MPNQRFTLSALSDEEMAGIKNLLTELENKAGRPRNWACVSKKSKT
jgi:hypothetical protein